jgi:aldehyde:ferredoxin oxidoreductase
MFGYAGKIAKINLSTKETGTIDTGAYIDWVGGHGMGSAIFWDLCEDKTIDGRDPRNVITVMISPTAGTLAACGGARTEVQGIGIQAYPTGWYTRANFGGRFAGQLKSAGWDGIVITGASDKPVWINIVNDSVRIEDATGVWGLSTWDTQQELWRRVAGNSFDFNDWWQVSGGGRDSGRSTQRPAVVAIG